MNSNHWGERHCLRHPLQLKSMPMYFFQSHTVLAFSLATLLGLIIGSFINVVIIRYPKMLKRTWQKECEDFLGIPSAKASKFNVAAPRSHCPNCKHSIKAWHNIPVLSYILLRGRCVNCKESISFIYPLVEILIALLAVTMAYHFGFTWKACAATLFTWGLLALSVIDYREQLLPDTMTIGLLWLGLLVNCYGIFTSAESAIIGAIVGYSLLWSVAKLFKSIRKKDGLGHGDFKMLAMLLAWLGIGMLSNILLLAIFSALIVTLTLLVFKKITPKNPIPFGPFLAFGGLCSLLFGPFLINLIINGIQ